MNQNGYFDFIEFNRYYERRYCIALAACGGDGLKALAAMHTAADIAYLQYLESWSYDLYRQTYYWKLIREEVRRRDGRKCRDCYFGSYNNPLEVHHLFYDMADPLSGTLVSIIGREHESLNSLRLLCRTCHQEEEERIFAKYYDPSTGELMPHPRNGGIRRSNKYLDDLAAARADEWERFAI